jgi:uncharacterized membrane protein
MEMLKMDTQFLWSAALTVVIGVLGFFIREKLSQVKDVSEDIKRVERLLNITREEIARDNVTQAEIDKIVNHIDARFDKLNDKIDGFMREQRSALS